MPKIDLFFFRDTLNLIDRLPVGKLLLRIFYSWSSGSLYYKFFEGLGLGTLSTDDFSCFHLYSDYILSLYWQLYKVLFVTKAHSFVIHQFMFPPFNECTRSYLQRAVKVELEFTFDCRQNCLSRLKNQMINGKFMLNRLVVDSFPFFVRSWLNHFNNNHDTIELLSMYYCHIDTFEKYMLVCFSEFYV